MQKQELNSIVFDTANEYGASQRSPFETMTSDPVEYAQLSNIVKSHFPEWNTEDIQNFIQKLKQEGCGYVAMINSLFDEFTDNRSGFQEAFGFDMYAADGTLNFNQVLVDLYCTMDNHIGGRFLFFTWDTIVKNEDRIWCDDDKDGKFEWKDKPFGNNEVQMKYRWETYCRRHGIKAKVEISQMITPKNYHKYTKKGSVCILCSNFTLCNTEQKETYIKNGHFMTITGVTEDDKYIVSSWGKQYTLNPKDIKGFVYYQVIRYKR